MKSPKAVIVDVNGETYSGEYFVTPAGAIVVHSEFGNAVMAGSLTIHNKEASRTILRGLVERKKRESA